MRRNFASAAALLALTALSPVFADSDAVKDIPRPAFKPTDITAVFLEQFTSDWSDRWTPSEATKKTPVGGETFSYVGKWEVEEPSTQLIIGDKGLVAKSKATHHAISAPLSKPFDFAKSGKPLVVQYEAKFQKGGNCGGGYVKLLQEGYGDKGQEFSDKTPWVVMFGPDLTCPGNKVQFIIQYQNPLTLEFEEHSIFAPPMPRIAEPTVLYTLIISPDNSFEIFIDGESHSKGTLFENLEPPINPPKEIADPDDVKPENWVEEAKIPDPDAKKPDDWNEDEPYMITDQDAEKPEGWLDDEPQEIGDPEAEKPEEWDDEEDGDWLPPTVKNPKCQNGPGCGVWERPNKRNPEWKGIWSAPQIDNPAYLGPWEPRKIANPAYFNDENPFATLRPIGGVGFEIWTMTEDILFDNIYIGQSLDDAEKLAKETFHIKKDLEKQIADLNVKSNESKDGGVGDEVDITFLENPVEFVRQHFFHFVNAAKEDPINAFKSNPQVGAVIFGGILTVVGMIGALFGLVGGAQKPVVTKSKKADAAPAAKPASPAPSAPAGGEKKDETPVKKRK